MCGRPINIEEKLMVVYGRLEALASCARQKLCSFRLIEDMIEAFDHMTVLSISSYLLLTRHRERPVAIRAKRTRCDQSNDGGLVEWRRCSTAEK